jgi:hypothetical protein
LEDLLLGAFGVQLNNCDSNSGHLQFTTRASGVEKLVSADFREYPIYSLLMLHQVLVCFILIHCVFANHEIYSSFSFKHKDVGTLTFPQLNAELRKGNFLSCLVNIIEVHDFSWGPTIKNRPNSGSNEFFNDITTTKDSALKVEGIFTAPDPGFPRIELCSAHSG